MRISQFKQWFLIFSVLVIVVSWGVSIQNGFHFSVDFTGGSVLQVSSQKFVELSLEDLKTEVKQLWNIDSVSRVDTNTLVLKGETMKQGQKDLVVSLLQVKDEQLEVDSFESVGPSIGSELVKKMALALAVVAVVIVFYVWQRFSQARYGVFAVLAMLHDTVIMIGVYGVLSKVFGIEYDLLFVTALLTTMSFSVHDTIVVYDRIREKLKVHPRASYVDIVDAAVIETVGRSLNNSITVIIMLVTLVLLGGESIKWFACALLIGAVTGTYSSTFTAVPLLLLWDEYQRKRAAKR